LKPREQGEESKRPERGIAGRSESRTVPTPKRNRTPRSRSAQASHALTLTLIWLVAFVAGLLLLESYVHSRNPLGQRWLLPEERIDVMKPWIVFYTFYLGGILPFWYIRPFKAPRTSEAERIRFVLALLCTLIFNGALLWLLAQAHLWPHEPGHDILADVGTATSLAKLMSFVVAPANLYYFGLKEHSPG
jgi:drug/metabolite transporter (DMT)-like permease